ncbi:VOC family protein [Xanthomonas maliensis]|uniref:VOC family protein n=1 Tax=Xanthomonas maliensis TaxID=1321368 RepID=UPI00039BAC63|nr:VOC family protein [Xanthomonas maliensis]KAB7763423.1 glyoxalase [Xanthomonas maliensis]
MQMLVNLDVPDLAAAEALYGAAFGWTAGRRFGAGALELLGAPVPIYLLAEPTGSMGAAASPRDYARHWTPLHLDIVVDQLEPALQRAVEAGLRQETPIREKRWGRIVGLADPWGHGWCLLQFVGRGYDEIAT